MNKKTAQKVAKWFDKAGYQFNFRHYGEGSWSVEIEGGKVFHTEEAADIWLENQKRYAAQAEADKALYDYDD